jgi:hypothetical protein
MLRTEAGKHTGNTPLQVSGQFPVLAVLIDDIAVWITQQQVATMPHPYRPFGKLKASARLKTCGFGPTMVSIGTAP